MVFGGKFRLRRCNSKASYLPRQSLDKLNTTDPDHGSYKLTLTSNEDSVNYTSQQSPINTPTTPPSSKFIKSDEIIQTSPKCNLPDVLPVNVKIQPSSQSPRYNINQNGSSLYPSYPNMKMVHQKPPINSSPSSAGKQLTTPQKPNTPPPSYQSVTRNNFINDSKYMSQSTIDLKKTPDNIDELNQKNSSMILSPAQSESNLNCNDRLSPYPREFQRTDVVRKLSLEEREPGEGRIVRAELVNTTLSLSPPIAKSEEKISIRKDSLRENIEKITQLQSKLMSAHVVENSNGERKLVGITTKTVKLDTTEPPPPLPEKEFKKSKAPSPILENSPKKESEVMFDYESIKNLSSVTTNNNQNENAESEELIQKTEIVFQINPSTIEKASQTDESEFVTLYKTSEASAKNLESNEIDCDKIANELASLLPSSEDVLKLSQILIPPKTYKSTADYVVGLYEPNIIKNTLSKRDVGTSTPTEIDTKKKFGFDCDSFNKKQINNADLKLSNKVNGIDIDKSCCDLIKKKEELINRLTQKLNLLNNEQAIILKDTAKNDQLGSNLLNKLTEELRPIDVTKFKTYIDDVGHITMLLLSLSGRLAKIDNALHDLEKSKNTSEKNILEGKRNRLTDQLDEAKRLKDDIDRRGILVYKIIEKNFTADDCSDYNYFINMKATLIVNSREISDKIKLNEEQIRALKDALFQSDC